jgi:FkbM family methyltransferase
MRRNVPKSFVGRLLRRAGYDISRYPPADPLQELLVSLRIDCVLDVGAFTGTTGQRLRTLGYAGPIISFEPASATFEELSRTASDDPLWHVHRYALGSEPGEARLNLLGASGSNSLLAPNEFARRRLPKQFVGAGEELVPVETLDRVVPSLAGDAQRLFLKIDAQGGDLQVLRGARQTLERVALLQVEAGMQPTYEGQPDYVELFREIAAAGFAPAQIQPTFWLDGVIAECDCLFLPRGCSASH